MQIVVLGMHRSGTSALCSLLDLAGVYFGRDDEFISTNEENPKGFWERKDVRRLNDEILYSLGSDWSEISNLEQEKLSGETRDSFQARAKLILDNLQENAPSGVTGLKDPRVSLLMDFWSGVLSAEVFYILLHRDAEEIAISLKTRNDIPVEIANYLTEQYLGNAISAIQTAPCHIISFAGLISDPNPELEKAINAIEKATGVRLEKPTPKDVETLISPSLYRSKPKGKPHPLSDQLHSWNEELGKGVLPDLKLFSQDVPGSVLSYEYSKRFSEFISLHACFRKLEKDYFYIEQKLANKHEWEQAAAKLETRITRLQSEQVSAKLAARDSLRLRNQLLDHLNTIQCSAAAQFARPLFLLERKWPKTIHSIAMLPKLLWWALTFRLRKNWHLHRQADMLLATNLFDLSWYIQRNSDVLLKGVDPVWHWLTVGWQEGRDPNPFFSTSWYLELNLDVADAGENPLMHYLSYGASEGRDPHPLFNNDWYLEENPDLAEVGANPLMHYLSYGATEGRSILPSRQKKVPLRQFDIFDTELERTTRKDLRDRYTASDVARNRLVSIILPTYNRADLITAAIKSVVDQTHKNWELLIIDDGSDDETAMVVSNFTGDERIKYIQKEHGGVCRARNAGLELAQGERVAFLDSDNSWDREFLALLLAAIETNTVEIVYCGLQLQQKGRTVGYRGEEFNYAECLKSNYVDMNGLMFKRSVIGDSRFDESIRRTNDWDFLLLVAFNRNVEYFPFVGVSYSFHERADQISDIEPDIYKKIVQERHKNRTVNEPLVTARNAFAKLQLDVAILLAAPREKRNEWGDYHYATGLARVLEQRGHKPRLYYSQEHIEGAPPDVTISLRGLASHEFMVGTIKVIWSISHPDLLTWQQVDDCDLLFCASLTWPRMLQWAGKTNVFPLLQCTDQTRFFPQPHVSEQDGRVLFVGNSRKADRPIVRHAVEAGVNLHIYGTNWAERVPKSLLKGAYIPNEHLTEEYAVASVVLNDHWPSMKDFGYISNRIFDVTASGGVLVSDHVAGIQSVFGDAVSTYLSAEDFLPVLERSMAHSGNVDRTAMATWVTENHTFQNRADDILTRVEEFILAKNGEAIRRADDKPAVALLGAAKSLRVGLVPQVSGASITPSAFIRLIQPLTSELNELTVDLKRVDQQEDLQDLDAVIVSGVAFDKLEHAERFLERSAKRGIPVVVDVDEAFHTMDESHPQFAEYRPKIDALNLMLESADEIWCSTVPLQDSLNTHFGQSILFPDSLDPRLWCSYRDFTNPPQREDNDCLELLYVGSVNHGNDLKMIMPVLDELEKALPIRLTVVGSARDISSRSWIRWLTPGVDSIYPRFAPWMRRQAPLFDVGIAPLADNALNRFKSDLRILEYRAMGLVPVASASQPYLASKAIEDQALCADATAWMDRLASLASDRGELEQMKKMVKDQNPYIWENRSAVDIGNQMASRLYELANHPR